MGDGVEKRGGGGQYGVTQEESWEGGVASFFSLSFSPGSRKGRKPEPEPTEERWMVGGGTAARALLIGRLLLSLWMD